MFFVGDIGAPPTITVLAKEGLVMATEPVTAMAAMAAARTTFEKARMFTISRYSIADTNIAIEFSFFWPIAMNCDPVSAN
jgi:hypothetical protein